jgi:mRNA-degrading endonuclease RelE of RelBE toxin-antitoxin system
MSYKIENSEVFKKQFKKLFKKYDSLKADLAKLIAELEVNPQIGTPLKKNYYKIQLAITSKHKGKSGGARIITHVRIINKTVYLLSIYDKADLDNFKEKDIETWIYNLIVD